MPQHPPKTICAVGAALMFNVTCTMNGWLCGKVPNTVPGRSSMRMVPFCKKSRCRNPLKLFDTGWLNCSNCTLATAWPGGMKVWHQRCSCRPRQIARSFPEMRRWSRGRSDAKPEPTCRPSAPERPLPPRSPGNRSHWRSRPAAYARAVDQSVSGRNSTGTESTMRRPRAMRRR